MQTIPSLPLRNPLGFGAADFAEAAFAVFVAALIMLRVLLPYLRALAARTRWCMLVLAILPVVMRLALLPHFPVPTPGGSDDFSHLLLADTLAHFRLANPPHPLHRFFEAIYVLQEPTYSSMYPPGQGLFLAIGKVLFGNPWAGVLLSAAAFCALCYWMLRAWTAPIWALAGGLLALIEFGPLNQWMNTYWANAIPAVAGCLVFGALPRFGVSLRLRYAVLVALGLALHLITRPFESILLALAAALYLPLLPWRTAWRRITVAAGLVGVVMLPAIALLLFQNNAVTGNWTTLPYMLSRYQYGIPATFVFEPNPIPHRQMTPEQELDYRAQSAIHGDSPETLHSYLDRLAYRVRYYRFFFLPPLYLALLAFAFKIREPRYVWVVVTVLIFGLASNLYPYFYPHYIGAVTCLFVLMSVAGLEALEKRWKAGSVILALCAAMFLCWYGIRLIAQEELFPALAFETWDYVNHDDPEGRIAINRELATYPGRQLVFVHYEPWHKFHEWIHNSADIDASRVIWALDLGLAENNELIHHYSDRRVWIVQPDAHPPKLTAYAGSPPAKLIKRTEYNN